MKKKLQLTYLECLKGCFFDMQNPEKDRIMSETNFIKYYEKLKKELEK